MIATPLLSLNTVWFFLIGILFVGYAILDGFDLGVGIVYLFAKPETDRRVFMDAIGPVWDGNEVWLVAGGGALFAAFPDAYAAAFSGFYLAFTLVLIALIFRAVAIEFRNKEPWPWWKTLWDFSFASGSAGSTFLFGIIIGNLIMGLPIGANKVFMATSFMGLFTPYPILVGLFVMILFALHGTVYLNLKTEGALQDKMRVWVMRCFGFFLVLYLLTTLATFEGHFDIITRFERYPWAWAIVLVVALAIANIPRSMHKGFEYKALITSASIISGTFFLFGLGMFPVLLPSRYNPAWNLTIYNAASSPKTLMIMLIVALIGIPFVLVYTFSVYRVFHGKVKPGKSITGY